MPASTLVQALLLFGLTACAYALWKGGRAERYAALIILMNFAIGAVVMHMTGRRDDLVPRLINDGLAAALLLVVTVIYGSPWLGLAMLLYGAQFSLHAYYFVTERRVGDHLFSVINNIQFGLIMVCLVAGTTMSWLGRIRAAKAAAAKAG